MSRPATRTAAAAPIPLGAALAPAIVLGAVAVLVASTTVALVACMALVVCLARFCRSSADAAAREAAARQDETGPDPAPE